MKRTLALSLMAICIAPAALAADTVIISQVYGGGGNSGATYSNDFVELYNTTSSAITMTNWEIAYASATGSSWTNATTFSGVIPAHGYFLIQESGGANGVALPTADASSTSINLSATTGKIALFSSVTSIGAVTCPASFVDMVSYGSGATACQGTPATGPSSTAVGATTSVIRKSGNANTKVNSADFTLVSPPNPRNSSTGTSTTVTITSLNPNNANVGSSDTPLTIAGSNFGNDSVINFGAAQITPSAITSNQLTATIPAAQLASPASVTVTVSSGGVTSNSLTFKVQAPNTCTETATIATIQGSGRKSSYVSTSVQQTSLGIVTYKKSNGFFMQMATGDGDDTTSDAIYVFTSSAPTVNLGDSVCVTGLISEYYNGGSVILTDEDNTLTEYGSVTVSVLSSNNPLPAAVTLNPSSTGAFDQLERYEGMRVTVPSLTVVGPGGVSAVGSNAESAGTYNPSGAFWGTVTGNTRPFREPGIDTSHPIYVENSTGANYGLLPSGVTLFDSNPERIQVYTGNSGSTVIDVSVGAVVTNISGVLDVYYGDFELDEDATTTPGYVAPSVSNNSLTYTAVPKQGPTEFTIATYNLEHFYDDQQNGTSTPFEVVLTTPTYQGRLAKLSMAIRNVLQTPDILQVEEAENIGVLNAIAAKVSSDAIAAGQTDPHYTAYLYQGNDPSGINVGFLVNSTRVTNVTATQYFATDTYTGSSLTFDRPPVLLTANVQNPGKAPLPVSVLGNHLKALPDDDPTAFSGATGTPKKRQAEAQKLAAFIQSLQAANPQIVLAVTGDLNSFEFNDGVNDMVGELTGNPATNIILPNTNVITQPLTELSSAMLSANQRQSYTEAGNAQQLDHILASASAYSRLTQFSIGHLDADFRESLHYDYTRPERLSDHDPEVAYFSLPAATDITSSITMTGSGLVLNRATQLYSGTLTLTNNSGSSISGPIQVFFNSLTSGVTLSNATAYQGGVIPYITSAGGLAPGASVTIPVQFKVTGSARVGYTNTIYSGTL